MTIKIFWCVMMTWAALARAKHQGLPSSALPPLEGMGVEGDAVGVESIVLEKAAIGRIISSDKRRRAAIVKVHQRYSFTHKTAKIQERRKSR